ncbi:MAG: Chromate transport protein ChrA, partial [uncultured Solirubrobacterales bacterium]
ERHGRRCRRGWLLPRCAGGRCGPGPLPRCRANVARDLATDLRRACGPDRRHAADTGRGEAMDRPAAFPACLELLHAASGARGPAAGDLHRVAAQRHERCPRGRHPLRAAGRSRPARAVHRLRRLRRDHRRDGALRRSCSRRGRRRDAGRCPRGAPSARPPCSGRPSRGGLRGDLGVLGSLPDHRCVGRRRGLAHRPAAAGGARGHRTPLGCRGRRGATLDPRRCPARRVAFEGTSRPNPHHRARPLGRSARRGLHPHGCRQCLHRAGPLLLGNCSRDLRWRLRRPLLRGRTRRRGLWLARPGRDGPGTRASREHARTAHHGRAVRGLPRGLPRPRRIGPLGSWGSRGRPRRLGHLRSLLPVHIRRRSLRRAAARKPLAIGGSHRHHRGRGRRDRQPGPLLCEPHALLPHPSDHLGAPRPRTTRPRDAAASGRRDRPGRRGAGLPRAVVDPADPRRVCSSGDRRRGRRPSAAV